MVLWVCSAASGRPRVDASDSPLRESFRLTPICTRPPMLCLTQSTPCAPSTSWTAYDLPPFRAGLAANRNLIPVVCGVGCRATDGGFFASDDVHVPPWRVRHRPRLITSTAVWGRSSRFMRKHTSHVLVRTLRDVRSASAWGAIWSQVQSPAASSRDVSSPEPRHYERTCPSRQRSPQPQSPAR